MAMAAFKSIFINNKNIFCGLLSSTTADCASFRQFRSGAVFHAQPYLCQCCVLCVKGECVDVSVNVNVFV